MGHLASVLVLYKCNHTDAVNSLQWLPSANIPSVNVAWLCMRLHLCVCLCLSSVWAPAFQSLILETSCLVGIPADLRDI